MMREERSVEREKYQVNLPVFEGPLDLLLHLVTQNRIDIQDIPIHEITEQYLRYLERAEQFNLELGSSFFTMASALLLIKSKMLLPKRKQEDGGEAEDPRTELVRSLEDFRRMKECKSRLEDLWKQESVFWGKEPESISTGHYVGCISLERLSSAFFAVYERMKEEVSHVVEADTASLDDAMSGLRTLLRHGETISLYGWFTSCKTRVQLAVSLLAVLELLRLREVLLQETVGGSILEMRRQ